jgi:sporulation protein YlmC with PRC-barrel domain
VELTKGTDIYTADGEKVGSIDRVVLDLETREVTHVVVQKGFLFT